MNGGGWQARDLFQQLGDDLVGGDAFGLAFEVQEKAMAQRGQGHCLQIFAACVEPALHQGADLARQHQGLGTSRAAAKPEVLARQWHCGGMVGVGG